MKECIKCHVVKADSEFYKGRGDCKECKINKSRKTYAPRKEAVKNLRLSSYKDGLKICKVCKEPKPVTEYRAHSEHWDKLEHECITCKLQGSRNWYNREAEIISEKRKIVRKKNREAGLARVYKWKNIAGKKASWHRRKAKKLQIGGSFSKTQWVSLLEFYCPQGACIACGEIKPLTADHVVSINQGGSSNIGNIQPICQVCNSSKGIKSTDFRFDSGLFAKSLESSD